MAIDQLCPTVNVLIAWSRHLPSYFKDSQITNGAYFLNHCLLFSLVLITATSGDHKSPETSCSVPGKSPSIASGTEMSSDATDILTQCKCSSRASLNIRPDIGVSLAVAWSSDVREILISHIPCMLAMLKDALLISVEGLIVFGAQTKFSDWNKNRGNLCTYLYVDGVGEHS